MSAAAPHEEVGAIAVVTGGAGGMGFACARRLGGRMPVLLADASESDLRLAADRLRADGLDVSSVVCDVTDPDAVNTLADEALQRGELAALVHTAGISPSM